MNHPEKDNKNGECVLLAVFVIFSICSIDVQIMFFHAKQKLVSISAGQPES
ncbi:hypothetical protein KFU94_04250 [Chloroflexi bacterium TSY]|nr:hypothetical protein [Chloroflexi bacterium TSY]